jgi:rhodanese-related sulfurtransferase
MPVPRITKEELKQRLESSEPASAPVIIDVRLKYPYEHSTVKLPGAIRVLPHEPPPSTLPRDRDLVAYDSDPDELVSAHVAATLIRQGYRVRALRGGIADWLSAKYPTDAKEAPKQKPPEAGALKG